MNVLFVVNTFPSFSETFIRDQITQLIDNGLDVRILCYSGFDESNSEVLEDYSSYNLRERTISFKLFLERSKLYRIVYTLKRMILAIRKPYFKFLIQSLHKSKYGKLSKNLGLFYLVNYILSNNIQIVHAHFGPNGNEMSILKEMGVPIKLVTTFHGYDIRLGYEKGEEFYAPLKKHGDAFLSISEYNKTSLIEFGFKRDKIIDLPNGVDVSFFNKKANKDQSIQKSIQIITVARLVPVKNLELAIHAFKQVVNFFPDLNFEYHIVGDGEDREKLEQLVQDLDIHKYVNFHGAKTTKVVRNLMVKSDIFMLSSNAEAFPTVLLEAKACGLPILATDVGSVKDMVNNCGIVVQSNSSDAFASGLKALIQNRGKWNSMAETSRKQIVKYYDIRKLSLKLIAVYEA